MASLLSICQGTILLNRLAVMAKLVTKILCKITTEIFQADLVAPLALDWPVPTVQRLWLES